MKKQQHYVYICLIRREKFCENKVLNINNEELKQLKFFTYSRCDTVFHIR